MAHDADAVLCGVGYCVSVLQPQAHPARDAHDTFFIKEPAETKEIPAPFLQATKEIHEKGGSFPQPSTLGGIMRPVRAQT